MAIGTVAHLEHYSHEPKIDVAPQCIVAGEVLQLLHSVSSFCQSIKSRMSTPVKMPVVLSSSMQTSHLDSGIGVLDDE